MDSGRKEKMSHIERIDFTSVGRNEGCLCDRCGQYIRNIWTVKYTEGFSVNYGIDCWEKVYRAGKLNQYGEKKIRKIMKSIKTYNERLAKYKSGELNAETDQSWQYTQDDTAYNKSFWYGKTFEEYRDWMINEFFPYRISEEQAELKKFSKVDFND